MKPVIYQPTKYSKLDRQLFHAGGRVEWFLRLLHFISFSDLPSAPLRKKIPINRSIGGPDGHDFGVARWADLHRLEQAGPVRTLHALPGSILAPYIKIERANARDLRLFPAHTPDRLLQAIKPSYWQNTSSDQAYAKSDVRSPDENPTALSRISQNAWMQNKDFPMNVPHWSLPQHALPVCPIRFAPPENREQKEDFWRLQTGFSQVDPIFGDDRTTPSDCQTKIGNHPYGVSPSKPFGVDEPRDGSSMRSHGPSGATLHLDGPTLGRWAVDHLGRVLAKPSSGITGVDPRAVLPKTRVSPF